MLKTILSFFSVEEAPDSPQPGMLFKGAEKPTTTLAYMIAAEILKMDPFKPQGGKFTVKGVKITIDREPPSTMRFEGKEYLYEDAYRCMQACNTSCGKRSSYYTVEDINTYSVPADFFRKNIHKYVSKSPLDPSVKVVGDVSFDERELRIISEAVKKAEALQVEKDKIAAIEKNQQKAVDLIAEWTGVPKDGETKPAVELPPCGKVNCGGDDCGGLCRYCD